MRKYLSLYVKMTVAAIVVFAILWALIPGFSTGGALSKMVPLKTGAPAVERTLSSKSSPSGVVGSVSSGSFDSSEASSEDFGWVVLKSGHVGIPVEDKDNLWNVVADVMRAVEGCGGIMVSQHRQSGEYPRFDATYRVPSDGFDACIDKLSKLYPDAEISVSSQDKTGEYVDITARLRVLEAERDFYERLLAKAESIDDMLKVKSALDQVISQIERMKARQQYLEDHAKWSTLSLSVYVRPQGVKPEPWWVKDLKEALRTAGMLLWKVLLGIVAAIVVIVPVAVLIWLVIWFVASAVAKKNPKDTSSDGSGAEGSQQKSQ